MMDSQDTNQPLEEDLAEERNATEVSDAIVPEASPAGMETDDAPAAAFTIPKTKEEILKRLKDITNDIEHAERQEIELLKQHFYRLHKSETEKAYKSFLENGGTPEDFKLEPDEKENEFKALAAVIKEKRNAMLEAIEKQKEENLAIKLGIIDKLKELTAHPEDANKNYNEFKKLQQQWNEIKLIPASQSKELWKNYQHYAEQFYDIIKLNNEFREYDFKKNLEIKTHLCEAAEKLSEEADVVSAFHQLQKLHQEFRETGPVAKELREEIWSRFKTASSNVNRRHQQHFEELKKQEQQNLDAKTAICEIVEATDYNELTSYATWENKTKEIIALQAKWKTIGFAPQKANTKIFERFRSACDEFFKKKGEFFKAKKEELAGNLAKKKALCEKAESLKDSTDWKTTAETLVQLQKEWKTIGPVAKKHSDAIWKRFIEACDHFFDQKNKATSTQHSEEQENLAKKKALIERLASINESTEAEDAKEQIQEIIQEWNNTGHVPFKEKDKIYKQYRELMDAHFERLHISISDRRLNSFKSNISNATQNGKNDSLYREREKLLRTYENLRSEVQTYENNIGFLNASSKKGNSLVNELLRKVEKLKDELNLIQKKIDVVDETLRKEEE